ncbi:MAG: metallophosphoesterase [Luteolibacter sp.]
MNISRREAIRKTVCFSSALFAGNLLSRVSAQSTPPSANAGGLHLLAFGDFGSANQEQADVAIQMSAFAKNLNTPLAAVLALGDNFYGKFTMDRFKTGFEDMYSKEILNCNFYACLGNHDYEFVGKEKPQQTKADWQLKYAAQNPQSRWKLPAKWYVEELKDSSGPLVRIIVLDGNPGITEEEKLAQKKFLEAELDRKTTAPWTWMVNHFPMFTASAKRKDNQDLIDHWGPLLKKHNISLFIAGHDHSLQHLEVDGYNTSFVISGGGGRKLDEVREGSRGFAKSQLGFNHIHVDRQAITTRFIDEKGNQLHAFKRDSTGKVSVV